jgi:hypothetical protein
MGESVGIMGEVTKSDKNVITFKILITTLP